MIKGIDLDITYKHIVGLIKTIDKTYPLQSHHYMTFEDVDFKGKVLDIGSGCCEFGIVAKLMKPQIEMYCIDNNQFVAALGKFLAVKAKADIFVFAEEIENFTESFCDADFFDIVVLSHVAEHVKDLDGLFKIVNRIIKKTGVIYLSFPHLNAHDSPEHVHYFSTKDKSMVNSEFHGMQKCINIDRYLKKLGYESEILLFDEEKADIRHPHKSRGQLDYFIKIKYGGEK